jgi:hypothetical protein
MIGTLMRMISVPLGPMLIGFVSELESHYLHSNAIVRDVAATSVTSLIQNNSELFVVKGNCKHWYLHSNVCNGFYSGFCMEPVFSFGYEWRFDIWLIVNGISISNYHIITSINEDLLQSWSFIDIRNYKEAVDCPRASLHEQAAIRSTIIIIFNIAVKVAFKKAGTAMTKNRGSNGGSLVNATDDTPLYRACCQHELNGNMIKHTGPVRCWYDYWKRRLRLYILLQLQSGIHHPFLISKNRLRW